jgi:hypothetical protein
VSKTRVQRFLAPTRRNGKATTLARNRVHDGVDVADVVCPFRRSHGATRVRPRSPREAHTQTGWCAKPFTGPIMPKPAGG